MRGLDAPVGEDHKLLVCMQRWIGECAVRRIGEAHDEDEATGGEGGCWKGVYYSRRFNINHDYVNIMLSQHLARYRKRHEVN